MKCESNIALASKKTAAKFVDKHGYWYHYQNKKDPKQKKKHKRWNAIDEPFLFWQINKKINPKGVLLKWIMNTPNKFSYTFPASTKNSRSRVKAMKVDKVFAVVCKNTFIY